MIPLDRNLLITGTSISLIALSFAVLKSFKVKRRRKQKKSIVWRALSREIGYRQTMVPCLNGLGYVYFALGQHKKAIKYHTQALAFAREINNRKEESISLGSLGRATITSINTTRLLRVTAKLRLLPVRSATGTAKVSVQATWRKLTIPSFNMSRLLTTITRHCP